MEIFNYIDTFFFISLGITFILILLLVFHFKQRMTILEEKTDTMFEIINNLVKEVISIKNNFVSSFQFMNNNNNLNQHIRSIPIINETIHFDNENNKIECLNDDDYEEDYEEEEEEEDDEEEEEDDEEEDDEEEEDDNIEEQLDLVIDDINSIDQVKIINIDASNEENRNKIEKIDLTNEENDKKKEDAMEIYRKMSLPSLKTLLITKGLSSDPSKMKKYDILKLLENNLDSE